MNWLSQTVFVVYLLMFTSAALWPIRTVRILRQFASPAEARKATLALWAWAGLVSLSGIGMTLAGRLAPGELAPWPPWWVWLLGHISLNLNFDKALKANQLPMGWAVLGVSVGVVGLACVPLVYLGFGEYIVMFIMIPFLFVALTLQFISSLNQRIKKPRDDSAAS